MSIKTPVYWMLVVSVIFWLAGCSREQAPATKTVLHVYYFNKTIRCPSCEKIERMTTEVVQNHFKTQLADGTMTFAVINVDKPEYAHFDTDYQLQAQSVVLSLYQGNKELRWKNLDKVWDLQSEDAQFKQYVLDEINAFGNGVIFKDGK